MSKAETSRKNIIYVNKIKLFFICLNAFQASYYMDFHNINILCLGQSDLKYRLSVIHEIHVGNLGCPPPAPPEQ